jgi:hypothetical protein
MNPVTAREVATLAHAGQLDQSGVAYIEHCRRVAEAVAAACGPQHPAVVVAWLHDVLEDTEMTADGLRYYGITEEQLAAVRAMTHTLGEEREAYIARVMQNNWARLVKRFDIEDNSLPARLEKLPIEKRERLVAKYKRDLAQLGV